MGWFKPKLKIEDFVTEIVRSKLPKAVQFYEKENTRGHAPLKIDHKKLLEVGGGMILFFLGAHFPDTEKKNLHFMSRAYTAAEKELPALGVSPSNAYGWWKLYTDVLIFKEKEDRLKAACRSSWEKLLPNLPFREASPLRTFAYYLQMEISSIAEKNIS